MSCRPFCFFVLVAAVWLAGIPVFAQTPIPAGHSQQPIEITAGRSLEWHRKNLQFIANGQVEAKQGTDTIFCDILTADYRDGKTGGQGSGIDIYRLTARGNVHIQSTDNNAYGDMAVYDVDKGLATLTGNNLKLVSPDQTVTASQRMEYHTASGEALAIGDAQVVRSGDTLNADTVKAFFKEDPATGQQAVDRLEATGHVVIVTPEEKLYGDKGIYTGKGDTAELIGNVRIERGPNVLEGERAEVNLTTNISKIFGGPNSSTGDTRVRGVFYPNSQNNNQ